MKKKPLTCVKKLNDLPLIILKTLIIQTQMHSAVAVAYKPAVPAVVEGVAYVLFQDEFATVVGLPNLAVILKDFPFVFP